MSPRSIPTYVTISPAALFAPFISSLNDRRRVALRASCAATDARFENTNARMLKTNPATEATLPQFPARKSIICRGKERLCHGEGALGRTDLAEADLARKNIASIDAYLKSR